MDLKCIPTTKDELPEPSKHRAAIIGGAEHFQLLLMYYRKWWYSQNALKPGPKIPRYVNFRPFPGLPFREQTTVDKLAEILDLTRIFFKQNCKN